MYLYGFLLGCIYFYTGTFADLADDTFQKSFSDFNYRLPSQNVNILHYELLITPYFDGERAFTFDGEAILTMVAKDDNVKKVKMHANQLDFKNIILTSQNGDLLEKISDEQTNFEKRYDFWTVNFKNSLPLNTEVKIHIVYTGKLQNDMYGFYSSSYEENGKTKWLATTQFQPVHARKAFPCFDEPQYKSRFTISLRRPKHFSPSLSNTKMNGVGVPDGELIRETFHTTPPMSTYLVAFVVSEFVPAEATDSSEKDHFAVWTRPQAKDMGSYAFNISKSATRALGNYLSHPFETMSTYLKSDHVAVPDFAAGAMENWGLVTYRESDLLYKEGETSARFKQQIASIIVHELTHFWMGDLVTCKWWSETWLNEGFAQYFMYFMTDELESMNMTEQFNVDVLQNALIEDSNSNANPLTNIFTNSPQEIKNMFGPITYKKGASVIRMMRDWLGHETFRRGLGRYIDAMKYKSSLPINLFTYLGNQADEDNSLKNYSLSVADFMISWTEKCNFPLLNVFVDRQNGTVTIIQEKFSYSKVNESETSMLWHVPITWSTESDPDFDNVKPRTILSGKRIDFEKLVHHQEWIVINNKQSGFYRVNYDNDSWKILSTALSGGQKSKIHPLNRAQIVSDAFALASAYKISFQKMFEIISFLDSETKYAPWMAAFYGFKNLKIILDFSQKATEKLKKYVITSMTSLIDDLGFEEKESDSHLRKLFRINVLNFACLFDHPGCLDHAKKMFDGYKRNSVKIHQNHREHVYCYGLKQGDGESFDILWNKYLHENVVNEKSVILYGLGCTTLTDKLHKLLDQTIIPNSPIRTQDKMSVFNSVLTGGFNQLDIAFEFFKGNIAKIRKYYGDNSPYTMIANMASRMNMKQLDNLYAMLDKNTYLTERERVNGKLAVRLMKRKKIQISKLIKGIQLDNSS